MQKTETLDPTTLELIEHTVREAMGPFGLTTILAHPDEDHDGDAVIYVEANYEASGEPIDPEIVARLAVELPKLLWDHGEKRFPHIRHYFDEQQQVKPRRRRRG
jgi:hypothetical protein